MPLRATPSISADLPEYQEAIREQIAQQDPITLAQLKRNLNIPTPSPWDSGEERFRVSRRLQRLNTALRTMVEDGEITRASWGTYVRNSRRGK